MPARCLVSLVIFVVRYGQRCPIRVSNLPTGSWHSPRFARRHLTLGFPAQPVVGQHDGDHRFRHGNEPGQQARIVSALGADGRGPALIVDRLLLDGQAARRFDRGPQDTWAGRS